MVALKLKDRPLTFNVDEDSDTIDEMLQSVGTNIYDAQFEPVERAIKCFLTQDGTLKIDYWDSFVQHKADESYKFDYITLFGEWDDKLFDDRFIGDLSNEDVLQHIGVLDDVPDWIVVDYEATLKRNGYFDMIDLNGVWFRGR